MCPDMPAERRGAAEEGAAEEGVAADGAAASGAAASRTAAAHTAPSGVVVHLSEAEPHRQAAVLRNTANLVRALEPGTPLELVTHGPGVELCTGESGLADTVAGLQHDAVTVCACANTLSSRRLTEADLLPEVTVVDSGVAHLVRRQRAGWAYLRP